MTARYDRIGAGYAGTRREDPDLRRRIQAALADARTVVNVGAGAGSYEPRDRHVVAIEPSDVMAAQRPRELAPAIRAAAGALPLRDGAVDAAMAVLTLHHWDDARERGVRELRRVARGPVVIVTCEAAVAREMWLMDYLPEVAEMDARIFPPTEQLCGWLGGRTRVEVLPIARDTPGLDPRVLLGAPRACPRPGRPRGDLRLRPDARPRRRPRRPRRRGGPGLRRLGRAPRHAP